jgi:hypothetical protein
MIHAMRTGILAEVKSVGVAGVDMTEFRKKPDLGIGRNRGHLSSDVRDAGSLWL